MERLADLIDRLNDGIGEVLKWAMPVIALICAVVAVLRYGFGVGFPWLSESYIWLNGALFTLGAAYVLRHEGHVRVDVFYNLLSVRGRAWINLLGTLVFLYPMLYFLAVKGWPGIQRSWARLETSPTIGGLPFMYLLKSCLLGFCVLLALQGLSLMIRSVQAIRDPSNAPSVEEKGRG
ncbi:TRAP transporter small permease subunit [Alloalcanivorax sp. C16-1]|uniref:TRAP transporter small permease subunit n=1 Tax=Alloalcanivorax sp. C16-1 TaxID=3390051 RepID=UPI0039704CFE